MGFKNTKSVIDAYDLGRVKLTSWRKQATQTTASGIWFDLSMSPGNPVPNYYASTPLQAKILSKSSDYGIDHGGSVYPMTKHVKNITAISVTSTAAPLPMILCDYLLYYPFIDMSVGGEELQPMDNSQASITRYTSGRGVQMMAIEVASQAGNSQFYVSYTNQDGVAGRITPTVRCNTQVVNGTVITSAPATNGCAGPFIPLQLGDTGVRSVEGVYFIGVGDVGLITIVLVVPLATYVIQEITAPGERDYMLDFPSLPRVYDDAYLNFICHPVGTLSGAQITGMAEFIWS